MLVFHIVMPSDYSPQRKTESIEDILSRLRAAPGVAAAGFTRAGMLIPEEIFVGTFVPPGRTPARCAPIQRALACVPSVRAF